MSNKRIIKEWEPLKDCSCKRPHSPTPNSIPKLYASIFGTLVLVTCAKLLVNDIPHLIFRETALVTASKAVDFGSDHVGFDIHDTYFILFLLQDTGFHGEVDINASGTTSFAAVF